MDYTVDQVKDIIQQAKAAAHQAASKFFDEQLSGQDRYACGFAWVNIQVKGNTKLGRALKAAGVDRNDYERCFQIWNPSGLPCQNVDAKEVGARAAAEVLKKFGFPVSAGSRLD